MADYPLSNRDAALVMLRLGMANLSEVARLAGVDRNEAADWAKDAGIDAFERREICLRRNWESIVHGSLKARPPRAKSG